MDEYLRALERRFQASGDPQDGLALFRAMLRSNSIITLDNFSQATWKLIVDNNLNLNLDSTLLALLGERLSLTLPRLLSHIINLPLQQQNLGVVFPNRPTTKDIQLIYSTLSRTTNDNRYYIYLYTLTKVLVGCQYCGVGSPHQCALFVHPASEGETIEIESLPCEEDDPLLQEACELDPPIKRVWYSTQGPPREMGITVRYQIQRWVFSNLPTEIPSSVWHLVSSVSAGSFFDAASIEEVLKIINRSQKDFLPGAGRPRATSCFSILNDLSFTIPQDSPHEPLEKPPTLITEPCEEFEVIPDGQVVTELIRGQVKLVEDTTTACGHGYLSDPEFLSLCPPMWSDGEQAGWRCNGCGKLLGMPAGKPGDLVMCKVCRVKARLEQDDEMGGPQRIKLRIFRCSCSEKFSTPEEAMECCGEDPSEITAEENWTWDDYDD